MSRYMFALFVMAILVPVPQAMAQGKVLRVLSPTPGATIYGNTIIVRVETSGVTLTPGGAINRDGQGHLIMMLDLQPLAEWDSAEPYALLNVPAGEHILTVELVQNDASSFTPPIVEQILFTTTRAEEPALQLPERLSAVLGESSATELPRYALAALGTIFVLSGGQLRW